MLLLAHYHFTNSPFDGPAFPMRFLVFLSCAASISSTVATVLFQDSSQSDSTPDDAFNQALTPPPDLFPIPPDPNVFSVASNANSAIKPDTVDRDDLTDGTDDTDYTFNGDETLLVKNCNHDKSHGNNVHRRDTDDTCDSGIIAPPRPETKPGTKPNPDRIPDDIKIPDTPPAPKKQHVPEEPAPPTTSGYKDEKPRCPDERYKWRVCCSGDPDPRVPDKDGVLYIPSVDKCVRCEFLLSPPRRKIRRLLAWFLCKETSDHGL